MSNKIEDLRNELFETLRRLKDPKCDVNEEMKRASQTIEVAKAIIDTGRLEIEFLRATGTSAEGTGFFEPLTEIKSIPEKAKN